MAFPLKVLGARVVVKLDPQENKTSSGIIIPGSQDEPVYEGEIMAVGEGMRLANGNKVPVEASVGDRVILSPMSGIPVEVAGEEGNFLVVNEKDIVAIIG